MIPLLVASESVRWHSSSKPASENIWKGAVPQKHGLHEPSPTNVFLVHTLSTLNTPSVTMSYLASSTSSLQSTEIIDQGGISDEPQWHRYASLTPLLITLNHGP